MLRERKRAVVARGDHALTSAHAWRRSQRFESRVLAAAGSAVVTTGGAEDMSRLMEHDRRAVQMAPLRLLPSSLP
jgi:hypothetical protein